MAPASLDKYGGVRFASFHLLSVIIQVGCRALVRNKTRAAMQEGEVVRCSFDDDVCRTMCVYTHRIHDNQVRIHLMLDGPRCTRSWYKSSSGAGRELGRAGGGTVGRRDGGTGGGGARGVALTTFHILACHNKFCYVDKKVMYL